MSRDWSGIRGEIRPNVPLGPRAWFRVGGPVDTFFQPADVEDLKEFLRRYPPPLPLYWIGATSNLLIRDQGLQAAVIQLGKSFSSVTLTQHHTISVQAGALAPMVAKFCHRHGIGGFEFLSAIPGSIGGCVAMNAGAFSQQISDRLLEVDLIDRGGAIQTLAAQDLGLGYRSSHLPPDSYVIRVLLKGYPESPKTIWANIQAMTEERRRHQPLGVRTGGSTFINPDSHKAWRLIDQAGCRGLRRANAQVSPKHPNFLINTGNATAQDLELLGETVRLRVFQATGVTLEWEIKRIGKYAQRENS